MFLSITKLRLKTPFHFFPLSLHALRVKKQLKESPCVRSKFTGVGMVHYTQSLWRSKEDMQAFMSSGAHLEAMKSSQKISSEIVVTTIDSMNIIPWNEAKTIVNRSTLKKKR